MEEPVTKKARKDDEHTVSVNESLKTLDKFRLCEVLDKGAFSKSISLLCQIDGDSDDKKAVVVLEKTPFKEEDLKEILTEESSLTQEFHNDIYGTYSGRINASLNEIKATVIHPATTKHISKYRSEVCYLVNETYEDYEKYTKPYIDSCSQTSLQWVENILTHKSEQDRIVFEDLDEDVGFVLLPDMKWNRERIEDLYLVAIVQLRSLRSVRELTKQHLLLLKNIQEKSLKAIEEKLEVAAHDLRVFVHYQPSYYHFHVHFTHIRSSGESAGGIQCTRAHLLNSIISNIELVDDYYQRVPLTFQVKRTHPLYEIFEKAGKFNLNTKKSVDALK